MIKVNQLDFTPFPHPDNANEEGLLAMGGDLTPSTLLSAYAQGIFPWFINGQPILWWSPDPRLVLYPEEFRASKSLKKLIRKNKFELSINQHFNEVIHACALRGPANKEREKRTHTWISKDVELAYRRLHQLGFAHSVEVNLNGRLVGGLYGVSLNDWFFGESMFSIQDNASKVALFALCQWCQQYGINTIDCQISSEHLRSLGAKEISRDTFLKKIEDLDLNHANSDLGEGFAQYWLDDGIKDV